MKKNLIIGSGIVLMLVIAWFIVKGDKSSEVADILANVKRGPF